MANSSDNNDDHALAYAAVSLFANESRGQAPQWHELSAWRNGTLPEDRSAEILSHVANDPDCFQQWLDIVEAEQWIEQQAIIDTVTRAPDASAPTSTASSGTQSDSATSLSTPLNSTMRWLRSLFDQPLAVYGGALAAITLAVLIVPLMRESEVLTLQQQMDRSLDTYIDSQAGLPTATPAGRSTRNLGGLFDDLSPADVARQHFQYGMFLAAQKIGTGDSAQWQTWREQLQSTPPNCDAASDKGDCELIASDVSALGQWTLLNFAACRHGSEITQEDYWATQLDLYEQFITTGTLSSNPVFGPYLSALNEQTSEVLCAVVEPLLTAGL